MARGAGAFDDAWLSAAEVGARVDSRQLAALARLLELQPSDITLAEDLRSPYRGLMSFEPEDAPLFGGRDVATAEVLVLLDQRPIVGIIGASGSGKSSLVKAGVVPTLMQRRFPSWRGLILRPGKDPLYAIARALGSELDRDADETTRVVRARDRARMFVNDKTKRLLADLLDSIVGMRSEPGSKPLRLLVFVDQWEEIYTQTDDPNYRRAFLDQLRVAFTKGPHRLVFTMRADFTGRLLDDDRSFGFRRRLGVGGGGLGAGLGDRRNIGLGRRLRVGDDLRLDLGRPNRLIPSHLSPRRTRNQRRM